jgi:hypothetical protein
MAIATYGITSKEVMAEITKLAINQSSIHKGMTVVFSGYAISKEEDLRNFFKIKDSFYKFELKRKAN